MALVITLCVTVVVLAVIAALVTATKKRAEHNYPPLGQFVTIDGMRLHYVDRGRGPALVLLHGNSVYLNDFIASGIVERLAENYRVIAFDRPGFGYSQRPRNRAWTAAAQAQLIRKALTRLKADRPIVLGHSWGTLVALELALAKGSDVSQLVLISGYYFPTLRVDAIVVALVAIPLLGDVLRYTVSALIARLLFPSTVKAMFAPRGVPQSFLKVLGKEMLLRPVQMRANAEDAAFMLPAAFSLRKRYGKLTVPTAIIAGNRDHVVKPDRHAIRLHDCLPNSELHMLPNLGHMLHYAAQDKIVDVLRTETRTRDLVFSV